MICAWDAYINLLPLWMREDVDKLGANGLQELRLRIGCNAILVTQRSRMQLDRIINEEDINFVINAASKYSPWTSESLKNGYITATGGHRIGVCGTVAIKHGEIASMQRANMLCLRVARDFRNISNGMNIINKSILIIGSPGCGKTTLLRDIIRQYSNLDMGSISVIDERLELFPISSGKHCFTPGKNTDVLSGVAKRQGIEMALRCMNPRVIAVDEISTKEDCEAIVEAGWCGVHLFATAHAGSREDLFCRPVYQPLIQSGLFDTLVIMKSDQSWYVEGMANRCIASPVQC